jgi:hypothetical protein
VTDADERVSRLIAQIYREEGGNEHLTECSGLTIADPDVTSGPGACDTGCERVGFTATLTCPHGARDEFEWSDWGELSDLLEKLDDEP